MNRIALLSLAMLLFPAMPVIAHPGMHAVETEVEEELPTGRVSISERDGYRYITSNGIPDHAPGQFPNRGNPNAIAAQDYRYRVTMSPVVRHELSPLRGYQFGVAVNGVPFDPGTAEIWTPQGRRMMGQAQNYDWNYDALSGKIDLGIDEHHAHVQPGGVYHYHGLPTGLLKNLGFDELDEQGNHKMTLAGYAADGFPIYAVYGHHEAEDPASEVIKLQSSYRLNEGDRPGGNDVPGGRYDGTFVQDWVYIEGSGDLDECNGRFGVTPEYPDGTYYYVLTETYPFVPRAFKGTPDTSFRKARPGRGDRPDRGDMPRRGTRGDERGPRRPPPPR